MNYEDILLNLQGPAFIEIIKIFIEDKKIDLNKEIKTNLKVNSYLQYKISCNLKSYLFLNIIINHKEYELKNLLDLLKIDLNKLNIDLILENNKSIQIKEWFDLNILLSKNNQNYINNNIINILETKIISNPKIIEEFNNDKQQKLLNIIDIYFAQKEKNDFKKNVLEYLQININEKEILLTLIKQNNLQLLEKEYSKIQENTINKNFNDIVKFFTYKKDFNDDMLYFICEKILNNDNFKEKQKELIFNVFKYKLANENTKNIFKQLDKYFDLLYKDNKKSEMDKFIFKNTKSNSPLFLKYFNEEKLRSLLLDKNNNYYLLKYYLQNLHDFEKSSNQKNTKLKNLIIENIINQSFDEIYISLQEKEKIDILPYLIPCFTSNKNLLNLKFSTNIKKQFSKYINNEFFLSNLAKIYLNSKYEIPYYFYNNSINKSTVNWECNNLFNNFSIDLSNYLKKEDLQIYHNYRKKINFNKEMYCLTAVLNLMEKNEIDYNLVKSIYEKDGYIIEKLNKDHFFNSWLEKFLINNTLKNNNKTTSHNIHYNKI